MAVRQAATVGVDWELARGADPPAFDKCPALALLAESQVLQEENRVDREGIVKLNHVYIGRIKLGHLTGGLSDGQGPGHRQVTHIGNAGICYRLAEAEHVCS